MVLLKSTFEAESSRFRGEGAHNGDRQIAHTTQKLISEFLKSQSEAIVKVSLQNTFEAVG
jgi:hypothetical protein